MKIGDVGGGAVDTAGVVDTVNPLPDSLELGSGLLDPTFAVLGRTLRLRSPERKLSLLTTNPISWRGCYSPLEANGIFNGF